MVGAGGVVVVWVVNAGVVVAAEVQVSNDGDGKCCCRIGSIQKITKCVWKCGCVCVRERERERERESLFDVV